MQIEVQKIIAATSALQEKLEEYNALASDAMAKQAVADEAQKAADVAKSSVISAVVDMQRILTEIQLRHQPATVAEVESSNPLTGIN